MPKRENILDGFVESMRCSDLNVWSINCRLLDKQWDEAMGDIVAIWNEETVLSTPETEEQKKAKEKEKKKKKGKKAKADDPPPPVSKYLTLLTFPPTKTPCF